MIRIRCYICHGHRTKYADKSRCCGTCGGTGWVMHGGK